jgi:hypothetical protein
LADAQSKLSNDQKPVAELKSKLGAAKAELALAQLNLKNAQSKLAVIKKAQQEAEAQKKPKKPKPLKRRKIRKIRWMLLNLM